MQDSKLRYSNEVKAMQEKLNAIGYNCGTPNGISDAEMDIAVKNLQNANGLTADGKANRNILAALDTTASGGSLALNSGTYSIDFDSFNKCFDTNQQVVMNTWQGQCLVKVLWEIYMLNVLILQVGAIMVQPVTVNGSALEKLILHHMLNLYLVPRKASLHKLHLF